MGLGYRHPIWRCALRDDMDPYAFMDSVAGTGCLIRLIFLAALITRYVAYYRRAVRQYLDGPLSTEIPRYVHRHWDALVKDLAVEYRIVCA